MRLLNADTDLATFLFPIRNPVSYSALLVRITGTAGGAGVTLSDFGRVQLRIRGQSIFDADLAIFNALDNLGGGIPEASGLGAAGAFAVSILIPRNYFDDNVEMLSPNDNAEFQITFGPAIATLVTGFLVELYALEEFGVMAYSLMIRQNEENIAGAGTIPTTINYVENIAAIYLTDIPGAGTVRTLVASAITRVRYTVGNKFNGDFSLAAGLAKTNLNNRVETAQTLMCEVFAVKVGDLSSKLEDQAQLVFTTSGAARPQIIVLGLMFNPNKLAETSAASAERIAQSLTMKRSTGKLRTAAVVGSVVGVSQS